ncbi:MAG: hypothetical protein J5950_10510 [Clostridia bacterium]|nr:hypothetical protein [Clostridia bacterium]
MGKTSKMLIIVSFILAASFIAMTFSGCSIAPENSIKTAAPDDYSEPTGTNQGDSGADSNPTSHFPELDNLMPDFEGAYSWADFGPELYLRFCDTDDILYYLVMGDAWRGSGEIAGQRSDIFYDRSTNVLTLNGFKGTAIDANLMGNGLTIELIGENHLNGSITIWGAMYGGSIRFTGNGSLVVNESRSSQTGIIIQAEWSKSCLMVDGSVTLEIYGTEGSPAVDILYTYLETVVYMSSNIKLDGGSFKSVSETAGDGTVYYSGWCVDESGANSDHITFSPK